MMAEDLTLVDMWQGSKKELKMKKLVNVLFQDRGDRQATFQGYRLLDIYVTALLFTNGMEGA